MVSSDRETLRFRFQKGKYLSPEDFAALIESTLNKHDDHFHGTWQQGREYCNGDIVLHCIEETVDGKKVIHSCNLWMMKTDQCICSSQPPPEDLERWLPFPDNGDWVVRPNQGVMWAKVFERVGIGIGSEGETGDRPQARLDVRKIDNPVPQQLAVPAIPELTTSQSHPEGQGRWLLFPQGVSQTQATLLHYTGGIQKIGTPERPPLYQPEQFSYFVTGLSLDEVTWCSDANRGFTFRQGERQPQEINALQLDPTTGTVMMVVQPRQVQSNPSRTLACLGLNTPTPAALLDITDHQRGHLCFLPDSASDPTLCLLRPASDGVQACATLEVKAEETVLLSNTAQGFGFYQGAADAQIPTPVGEVLLKLRQGAQQHPQMGIGIADPAARLDIMDSATQSQVKLLPEQRDGSAIPALILLQHQKTDPVYLTTGLTDRVSGWISNAEQGFVFRQAIAATTSPEQPPSEIEVALPSEPLLLQAGKTHLAIRETGYVGIGTETPATRLEITSDAETGAFRFDPDQQNSYPALGICNLKSRQNFTLGTSVTQAVLTTDAPGGFGFMAAPQTDAAAQPLDLAAGRLLVNLSPEGNGRMGIGRVPRDYELDVHGIIQGMAVYQDMNADQVQNVKPLTPVLAKLQQLQPITFEWRSDAAASELAALPSHSPASESAPPSPSPESPPAPNRPTAGNPDSKAVNRNQRIGLLADQVDRVFPEVVKTANDGSQSVAYTNLVPVLVQAINELNHQHRMEKRRLENLIAQLGNRIALLAILVVGSWVLALFSSWLF